MKDKIDLEILLPAHNEAESIENTVKEIYEIFSEKIDIFRFLICEDGSSDGTIEIIEEQSINKEEIKEILEEKLSEVFDQKFEKWLDKNLPDYLEKHFLNKNN